MPVRGRRLAESQAHPLHSSLLAMSIGATVATAMYKVNVKLIMPAKVEKTVSGELMKDWEICGRAQGRDMSKQHKLSPKHSNTPFLTVTEDPVSPLVGLFGELGLTWPLSIAHLDHCDTILCAWNQGRRLRLALGVFFQLKCCWATPRKHLPRDHWPLVPLCSIWAVGQIPGDTFYTNSILTSPSLNTRKAYEYRSFPRSYSQTNLEAHGNTTN
jgi:hypothetical protein